MSIAIDLSDQIVLVTGGTRGIGHACVERFLAAGSRVAFCAPEADQCEHVARDFQQRFAPGDRVMAQAADLRDTASLDRLVHAVVARWGRIDTLICNGADFGVDTAVEQVDTARYIELLQANVVGNFHICRIVLPKMKARGAGSVILMTSIVGFTTMPRNIPYSSSKAALMSIARSLAADTAATGVRVNCISPGLIKTESSRVIWENEDLHRTYVAEKIPMRRIGQPDEIANACLFLASPLASYITGTIIPVDGGRMGIGLPAGAPPQDERRG